MSLYLTTASHNLSTITSLQLWKQTRHELLCAMAKIIHLDYTEDHYECHVTLIKEFCHLLLYYLSANHFAGIGWEEIPVNRALINQILATTKNMLAFYDKYQTTTPQSLIALEADNDLLLLSEVLATHLELEEMLLTNLLELN